MRKKTICFFSGDITRDGGTERAAIRLVNMLHKRISDCRFIFLSLTEQMPAPTFIIEPGIRRFYLNDEWVDAGPKYLTFIPKLHRFLIERHVDLIVDIDIVLDSLSVPAAKGLKTKVVSWEHFDFSYECTVAYRRVILKFCTKKADAVVTLSKTGARRMRRYLDRKQGVVAIPNPMPKERTDPMRPRKEELLTVGHLTGIKGTDLLPEVAERILKEHEDWKWIVIGEGDLKEEVLAGLEKKGLSKQVVLTGHQERIDPWYESAAIYVSLSRSEGLPMTLLEAKAHGLPIVGFSAGGVSEVVRDKENALLYPVGDVDGIASGLKDLMDNEKKRLALAKNSLLDTERYSKERILKTWLRLFRKVLL